MPDYEKMYHILFNAITDSLRFFMRGENRLAESALKRAQLETEALYIQLQESETVSDSAYVS